MLVIGTAGHVDHGKSSLVRALTGTDPDRLAEEKRRGLSIDLGFAWTDLPGQDRVGEAQVAFVDVPGHADFMTTTLAGVGPARAVLLVVAADEGWQPQSEEHLLALEALAIRRGVVAITKSDLASPAPVAAWVKQRLRRTCLAEVDVVAASARTGGGLDLLRRSLARVEVEPVSLSPGRTRLWVDRSFAVQGSGTVLTGTLSSGELRVGQRIILSGRSVTVRGLQSCGVAVEHVTAPARVAVNVRDLEVSRVHRGDALVGPDWILTHSVDAAIPLGTPPATAMLHLGTSAQEVGIRPLADGFARLGLPRPLPLTRGDRGVLRASGTRHVLGGVRILDVDPPALERRGAARARARALTPDSQSDDPIAEVSRRGVVGAEELRRLGFVEPGPAAASGEVVRLGDWWVSAATLERWTSRLAGLAEASTASGAGLDVVGAALVRDLGLPDPALLEDVVRASGLALLGGRVRTTTADLGVHEGAVAHLERRLRAHPFDAPSRPDLAELELSRAVLGRAERDGRLLLLPSEVVLLPDALDVALDRLGELTQPFTTSAAREALGTSRRVTLAVLTRLDAGGRTRRLPDDRREISGRRSRRP